MAGRSKVENIRVEIKSRSSFWQNAVLVEWDYQFPQRRLEPGSKGVYLIEEGWLEDLERVAAQCFSKVLLAPRDPGRRQLFRKLLARDK
ncbi:MAG: hypothetical protein ABI977_06095 [Acidobacteriota bacterium]